MPTVSTGRSSPLRRAPAALSLGLVLTAGVACSVDPSQQPERAAAQGASTGATPAPEALPTTTTFGKVYGRLPRTRRAALKADVGRLVDTWWEAAYLGGTYPRGRFSDSFPGFTPGAEAKARRDKLLTTNRDIGEDITAVTARRREVTLDVLAIDGTPRTVTARFRLRFDTDGPRAGRVGVGGRLFLTRRAGQWRVFGYDISKWSTP